MIGALTLGLGLMVIAGLGAVLVESLIRRADVGAALVLGVTVLNAALGANLPTLMLGSVQLRLTDAVFALVLVAAVARLLRMQRFTKLQRWLLVLAVMLLLSLLRGAGKFGFEGSLADFRPYLRFAGGALYFASFPPSEWLNDRIGRIWLVTGVPMMVLVCLRWLSTFAGLGIGVLSDQYNTAIRAVNGGETFFLAEAFLLTMPAWQTRDPRARWLRSLGAVLLLFVLLLNRRTVWLALLIGMAVIVLRDRKLGRRGIALAVGAAVVTAGVLAAFPETTTEKDEVAKSAADTGTLEWRIEGWKNLMGGGPDNPTEWLVGQPFGSGFARQVNERELETNPHSFYLQTLLRTGVVGLLALIVVVGGLLRATWRIPQRGGHVLAAGMLPALLTMQFIWFITWVPGMEQGLVTGLAVSWVSARLRPPRPPSAASSAGGAVRLGDGSREELHV
ncbi:MAG: O-antigen ligase family protein [Egibacteraceae bacterium]